MTDSIFHRYDLLKRSLIALLIVFLFLGRFPTAAAKAFHLEKKIRQIIASEDFNTFHEDRRCPDDWKYRVYMIDNFEQGVDLVPEVLTSHGEMLEKILRTGRDDIELVIMNTALSKGLKQVIRDLIEGECVDAVVSSVPGSNYTYGQISTLLPGRPTIDSGNILYYRSTLRHLLSDIAFGGFPSVEWLDRINGYSIAHRMFVCFGIGKSPERCRKYCASASAGERNFTLEKPASINFALNA